MKIAIANDHGGYNLKKLIIRYLAENKYEYIDLGCDSLESCDYPDYALKAAKEVKDGKCDFGILICGTGIGISIAANKVKGIRAALCHDTFSAKAARAHNNANMIAFGERVIGPSLMLEILEAFLHTDFDGGRHEGRVDKISSIEENQL